jgi:hypothetical protein
MFGPDNGERITVVMGDAFVPGDSLMAHWVTPTSLAHAERYERYQGHARDAFLAEHAPASANARP